MLLSRLLIRRTFGMNYGARATHILLFKWVVDRISLPRFQLYSLYISSCACALLYDDKLILWNCRKLALVAFFFYEYGQFQVLLVELLVH